MFVGLKNDSVLIEVCGLPKVQRGEGELPVLHVITRFGLPLDYCFALVPKGENELLIVLAAEEAENTIKATEFSEVPHLFSLPAAVEEIANLSIKFGDDPIEPIAKALKAFGGRKEEIERRIAQAAWWLKFGLGGNAYGLYLAAWTRLHELLQFVPGIEFPEFAKMEYEQGEPLEAFGMTTLNFVMFYLTSLTDELRLALNNPSLVVKFEVLASHEAVQLRCQEGLASWQQFYGAKWGPFTN